VDLGERVDPPDGLVDFYRREYPRVVGALSLYCGDRFVAEELAHEALVRARGAGARA
jgi:DNA-directed RNA polymerase specialized sigma24 family protein